MSDPTNAPTIPVWEAVPLANLCAAYANGFTWGDKTPMQITGFDFWYDPEKKQVIFKLEAVPPIK